MEQGPVLVLTFVAQQVSVLKDAHGNVVEGGEVSGKRGCGWVGWGGGWEWGKILECLNC